jgi:hypothetical protein
MFSTFSVAKFTEISKKVSRQFDHSGSRSFPTGAGAVGKKTGELGIIVAIKAKSCTRSPVALLRIDLGSGVSGKCPVKVSH